MKTINKSRIIPYLAKDMYSLVANVKSYPEFVPYCSDSDIVSDTNDIVTAYIELSFHGIRKKITTKNTMILNEKIMMKLVDGPLSFLEGSWNFSGVNETNSKIELSISYEVLGFGYATIFETVIGTVSDQILMSFVKRAKDIYG